MFQHRPLALFAFAIDRPDQYMPPIETRKTRNEHIKRELGKNQNNKGKREHLTRDTPWAATRKST